MNFQNTGHAITPSFAKSIGIGSGPVTLKFYLHHGVYLSWDFTGVNRSKNRQIYFAIKILDLVFINSKRKRLNLPFLKNIFEMEQQVSTNDQTFREDLAKFIGMDRLLQFERENDEFIQERLRNFYYIA